MDNAYCQVKEYSIQYPKIVLSEIRKLRSLMEKYKAIPLDSTLTVEQKNFHHLGSTAINGMSSKPVINIWIETSKHIF